MAGASEGPVATEPKRSAFMLLTISDLVRWALAAIFGLRARFDTVGGLRLLIRRSERIGVQDNRLCGVTVPTQHGGHLASHEPIAARERIKADRLSFRNWLTS
jgi:hypothetical protein